MYGGATVACRVCYRDQYGTPPRELGCNTPWRGKGTSGYRVISRLCHWEPTGRRSGADARRGCEVRCRSCGSRNGGETTECGSSQDGPSPYRYLCFHYWHAMCSFFFEERPAMCFSLRKVKSIKSSESICVRARSGRGKV